MSTFGHIHPTIVIILINSKRRETTSCAWIGWQTLGNREEKITPKGYLMSGKSPQFFFAMSSLLYYLITMVKVLFFLISCLPCVSLFLTFMSLLILVFNDDKPNKNNISIGISYKVPKDYPRNLSWIRSKPNLVFDCESDGLICPIKWSASFSMQPFTVEVCVRLTSHMESVHRPCMGG